MDDTGGVDNGFQYMDLDSLDEDQLRALYDYHYNDEGGVGFSMPDAPSGPINSWEAFAYTFPQCYYPTLSQIYPIMLKAIGLSLALRLAVLLRLPRLLVHALSLVLGIAAVWMQFGQAGVKLVCAFELLGYAVYRLSPRQRGMMTSLFVLVFLFTCEIFIYDATTWHSWRGSLMIAGMKMLSVAFDADGQRLPGNINIVEHAGFCLSCVTVVFGPFMQFQTYESMLQRPPLTVSWVVAVVRLTVTSFLCLILSSCVLPHILTDSAHKWALAYTAAASFRYSHYFVCYLSESCAVAAGHGGRQLEDGTWSWSELPVVRLYHVELPRSLVEVVTNWNISMHLFLKNYVYKPTRHLGMFAAILVTYFASALLHGINLQLGSVLFSIGLYSYVENVFRSKLSKLLDACILARRCSANCSHKHKAGKLWVRIVNILFSALAVFHLAYLGLMFDNTAGQEKGHSLEHTLSKWRRLDYASHVVAFTTYLISVVLPAAASPEKAAKASSKAKTS